MIKKIIKNIASKFGFQISKIAPNNCPSYQLQKFYDEMNIDLIIDIGANEGQFIRDARKWGYRGEVWSFEPSRCAFNLLYQNSINDPKWCIYHQAVGDFDGEIELNISKNSVSSSILGMEKLHLETALSSIYIDAEVVKISRLDAFCEKEQVSNKNYFVKIDVQGYEANVLKGGMSTLKNARGVLCELSLVPLYEEQELWLSMVRKFDELGLSIWSIYPGFTDQNTGKTLQVDVILFNRKFF
jgi:FkbM family methyltransferase